MAVRTLYIRDVLHQSPKNNSDIENNSSHDNEYGFRRRTFYIDPYLLKIDENVQIEWSRSYRLYDTLNVQLSCALIFKK